MSNKPTVQLGAHLIELLNITVRTTEQEECYLSKEQFIQAYAILSRVAKLLADKAYKTKHELN